MTLGSLRVVFGDGEGGLPFGADFLDEIGDVFGLRCIFKSFAICSLAVMWSNVPSGWSFATSASSSVSVKRTPVAATTGLGVVVKPAFIISEFFVSLRP